MIDDLDGDIRAALASAKEEDGGQDEAAAGSSAGGEATGGSAGAADVAAADDPAVGAVDGRGRDGETPADTRTAAQRARDNAGRFVRQGEEFKDKTAPKATIAPKAKAAQPAAQPSPDGKPEVPGATPSLAAGDGSLPQTPELRPPSGWTPAAKEKWATLPPEIQREVAKREREITIGLNDAAPAKRFQQEVTQAFAPFQQVAQQLGVANPVALGVQAAQIATRIATAPPHIAARELAQLIRSRPDMDPGLINGFLEGGPQQAGPAQGQAFDPEAVARQAEERVFQRLQQQRQQSLMQSVQQEVAEFEADPAHAYATDPTVRGLMAAIMGNPGFKGSIKDAYDRALWASPEHRGIVQQKAAAEQAKVATASTQQRRAAASSIQSQPAPVSQGPAKDDLDSTIRAAMAARSRSR